LFKFIGAVIGFFFLGKSFFGAFIGFLVGSFIDNFTVISKQIKSKGGSTEDIFSYYQRHAAQPQNDFPTMLMALSAAVMRADGKATKAELDFIKAFFNQQFGPQFSVAHLQELKHFVNGGEIPLERICEDIRLRTQIEVRIQLMHYLFGIAKADGHVADVEIQVIQRISSLLAVPHSDFESVKNMFYRNVNSDYAVLGIERTATEEEIKKAYRQMAIRYHPDKVAQMGEEFQHGAKEKFQKIQEAYESIKKQRGMN
jgi:DnaJ like chaperone protein